MTSDDLDAVMRLSAATAETPQWEAATYQAFLAESSPPRRIFVAESSSALIGFIAGQIALDVCELESIGVAQEHRRSGVASALISALIAWASGSGASKVQLEVRAGNIQAIRLYERHEFSRDGLRRGYYRDPEEDAVLMSRVWSSPTLAKALE
jgi:ribosomal-protein-alanine N-acetyltransferase